MKIKLNVIFAITLILAASCTVLYVDGEETDAAVPSITEQPKDAKTDVEEPFTLNISAESPDGGTLDYQWYKVTSGTTADLNKAEPLQNQTQTSLTLLVTEPSVNYYFCKITNTNTSRSITRNISAIALTTAAKVEIIPIAPPYITTAPVSVTVLYKDIDTFAVTNNGDTYTFTAEAGCSSYRWLIDGNEQECTQNTFDFDTTDIAKGTYAISVEVIKKGKLYSATWQLEK